jgi:signal transduction histidine kinase
LKNFSWSVNWSPDKKTYFCVAHDVTERRALEKLKQQFLAIVSQDLRIPVTATSNSISVLLKGERGELSEGVLKILERTQTSIVRLTELVNDLLELDKLEAGKLVLNRAPTSAARVCNAAKEALEAMANSSSVHVVGPVGDSTISGDELRLVQAVINLLSNAIKFSPKNSEVKILIVENERSVELQVVDEGPGIPQEDANLIFEKFRQSATAKQSKMKSTGLGLAIVKAIAEAHGGNVGVESEVGKGSTFSIRLPLIPEEAKQ